MITEPFQGLASSFSASLGVPGYHNAMVPHPIATRDDERLSQLADRVVDTVAAQLTTGS